MVGLEEFKVSSALSVRLPVSRKKFSSEGLLLRLAEVAEFQENRPQQLYVDIPCFPSHIEVVWDFFIRDEAAVKVYFQASGLAQASQSGEQAPQQAGSVCTGTESFGGFLPSGVMDA